MSIYLNNPWKAVKHVIFKNDADRDEVFEQGYMLAPKLGKEQLEKLAARPDIDTVCAFDYVRMKNHALNGDGLKYQDYHPEIKGIKVPQL